ncbi:MAG TPA: queuosine salvage family protein [Candidatus Dormibacteraeota bacterium]|nr:queuosine salvage family protein [Candidatus Dormibacteraeota bacterium]
MPTADPLGVRAACASVVERAQDVGLGPLEPLLGIVRDRPVPAWDARRHYSGPPERTRRYLLVLDTINFCFWTPGSGNRSAGGYWRLAERLRDAFAAGDELSQPARLAEIDAGRLRALVGDLPMLDERAAALRELGRHGFEGLIQETAAGTARTLSERLPSYADVAEYEGRPVPLLKRAQILPADLHGAGVARFPDLATLTCFPDYKLPQVLCHFGVLRYSARLARRIDAREELQAGEPAEVEIRAATVIAVERLREALAAQGRPLRSIEVDWILWDLGQSLELAHPHHRTRTVFY